MGSDGSASELYFVKTQLQEWRCLWEAHSKRYLPEHAQQRLPSEAARSCHHVHLKGLCLQGGALKRLQHFASLSPGSQPKVIRVVASLYDSRTASLFGSQCFSKPVALGSELIEDTLRFDFDVFWCSHGMHPAQSMLLQFTMAAHDSAGALVNEYCVAWGEIHFQQDRHGVVNFGAHGGACKAAVNEGTALYVLVAQGAYARVSERAPKHVAPPVPLQGCTALFTVSSAKSFGPACGYVQAHQLVTHHSLVPGLTRFDLEHEPTLAVSRFSRTALLPAEPCCLRSVQLARVEIHVDETLLRLADGRASRPDLQSLLKRATAASRRACDTALGSCGTETPTEQTGVAAHAADAESSSHPTAHVGGDQGQGRAVDSDTNAHPDGASASAQEQGEQSIDSPLEQQDAADSKATATTSKQTSERVALDIDSPESTSLAARASAAAGGSTEAEAASPSAPASTASKLQTQLSAFTRSLSRTRRAAEPAESATQPSGDAASAAQPPGNAASAHQPPGDASSAPQVSADAANSPSAFNQRARSPWRWFKKSKPPASPPQPADSQQQEALQQLMKDMLADHGDAQLAAGQLVWVSLQDRWVVSTIARAPRGPKAAQFAVEKIARKRVPPLAREQLVPASGAQKGTSVSKSAGVGAELESPALVEALLRNDVRSEVQLGAAVWMQLQRWNLGEVTCVRGGARGKTQPLLHDVAVTGRCVTVQRGRLLRDASAPPAVEPAAKADGVECEGQSSDALPVLDQPQASAETMPAEEPAALTSSAPAGAGSLEASADVAELLPCTAPADEAPAAPPEGAGSGASVLVSPAGDAAECGSARLTAVLRSRDYSSTLLAGQQVWLRSVQWVPGTVSRVSSTPDTGGTYTIACEDRVYTASRAQLRPAAEPPAPQVPESTAVTNGSSGGADVAQQGTRPEGSAPALQPGDGSHEQRQAASAPDSQHHDDCVLPGPPESIDSVERTQSKQSPGHGAPVGEADSDSGASVPDVWTPAVGRPASAASAGSEWSSMGSEGEEPQHTATTPTQNSSAALPAPSWLRQLSPGALPSLRRAFTAPEPDVGGVGVSASLSGFIRAGARAEAPAAPASSVAEAAEKRRGRTASRSHAMTSPLCSTRRSMATLEQHSATCPPAELDLARLGGLTAADLRIGPQSRLAGLAQRLAISVSVHNGFRTVGEPVLVEGLAIMQAPGSEVFTVAAPAPIQCAAVPQDVCCVVVLELLLLPEDAAVGAAHSVECSGAVHLGWAAVVPFASISPQGVVLCTAAQGGPLAAGPSLSPSGAPVMSCGDAFAAACLQNGLAPQLGLSLQQLAELLAPGDQQAPLSIRVELTGGALLEDAKAGSQRIEGERDAPHVHPQSPQKDPELIVTPPQIEPTGPQPQLISPPPEVRDARVEQVLGQQEALQQQNEALLAKLTTMQQHLSDQLGSLPQQIAALKAAASAAPVSTPGRGAGAEQGAAPLATPAVAPGDGHHVSGGEHAGVPASHAHVHTGVPAPSRGQLAHLLDAAAISPATSALSAPLPEPRLELEACDARTVNTVILEFLAFAPTTGAAEVCVAQGLFLRFRFFDFQPSQTPPYSLVAARGGKAKAKCQSYSLQPPSEARPLKFAVDGTELARTLQDLDTHAALRNVDAQQLVEQRHLDFVSYAMRRQLCVDVFAGASKLHVGMASLDLRGLLRQGREHCEHIMSTHVRDVRAPCTPPAAHSSDAAPGPALSLGQLQVRLTNVGSAPSVVDDLIKAYPPQLGTAGRPMCLRSRPLFETSADYVSDVLPSSAHPDNAEEGAPQRDGQGLANARERPPRRQGQRGGALDVEALRRTLRSAEERKIAREARLRNLGVAITRSMPRELGAVKDGDIQARLLADVATTRTRHKLDAVNEALQASKLRHHGVVARPSELCLLESIELCNPGLEAQMFKIEVDSPWLRPIGTVAELLAIRAALHGTARADDAVGSGDILTGGLLLLQAQEALRVPFALQMHGVAEQSPCANRAAAPIQGIHTIDVRLVDRNSGSTVMTHRVLVFLRRPVIDRTFRFHAARTELLRERVHVASLPAREHTFDAPAFDRRALSAVCTHPDVVVAVQPAKAGEAQGAAVLIKAKSPTRTARTDSLLVALFADRRQAQPIEIWQVHLHFLDVHDVSATCGQSTAAIIVLPAAEHAASAVTLFSSQPRELRPKPDSLLLSQPASVALHYRPLAAGCAHFLLNVVERATGRVADTLLVRAHAHAPQVTRMFEVDVPKGCAVHKKVAYRNMYPQRRRFSLGTSHPAVVTFAAGEVSVPALEQRNLGLQIRSRGLEQGMHDVYIFVNDEEDRVEECYRLRMHVYTPQD